jgi:hypothetical protein
MFVFFRILLVLFVLASDAFALRARFTWDRNPDVPECVGYKVCIGTTSRVYTKTVYVKNTASGVKTVALIVNGFQPETTYYAAVKAVGVGEESDLSEEIVFTTISVNLSRQLAGPSSGNPYGSFSSSWAVAENGNYRVEKSNDLSNWEVLETVNVSNGILSYVYMIKSGETQVFLRIGKVP